MILKALNYVKQHASKFVDFKHKRNIKIKMQKMYFQHATVFA